MSFHDLRSFLASLERNHQLQRAAAMVDPHLESTALSLRALREGGPALLMEQRVWNRELLGELSQAMRDASICGLGQAASNPLTSVIKYFPDVFMPKEAAE